MVEMANHKFRGRQPRRELQKMEQGQRIHSTGDAHQNTVARVEELPLYNVGREIVRESEVRVQWSKLCESTPCDSKRGTNRPGPGVRTPARRP